MYWFVTAISWALKCRPVSSTSVDMVSARFFSSYM